MPDPKNLTTTRRPYPNSNGLRPFVLNELQRRKTTVPTPTIAPFVRFTSMQQDRENNYKFFSLGLHGYEAGLNENIFDKSFGGEAADVVGYGYQEDTDEKGKFKRRLIRTNDLSVAGLGGEFTSRVDPVDLEKFKQETERSKLLADTQFARGAHPIPGINGVDIERGQPNPTISHVRWSCYNRAQLEFIRNHFLIAGNYVVLEWGNVHSDRRLKKVLDYGDPKTLDELVDCLNEGRRRIITNWIEPNDGNYEFIIGRVMNFQVSLDARQGIYRCVTDICSIGEAGWGLSTYNTAFQKKTDADTKNITTISDYFAYGNGFEKLINSLANDPKMVAKTDSDWSRNNQNTGGAQEFFKNFSTEPIDNHFISWECFATRVINDLVSLIDDENVQNDLKRYLTLMPIEGRADPEEEDWVGANPALRSTDPSTMILISTELITKAKGFGGAGAYDSFPQVGRGKLSRGVWLNSGAIRHAFLSEKQFYFGLQQLLTQMNNATENYWNLQIFFDEETNNTKVVDANCSSNRIPHVYLFNEGEKGELLNMELQSAFPPELAMMVMNYNNYRTNDLPTREELLKKFPSIAGMNGWIFSLNWTGVKDALSERIAQRAGGVVPATTALKRPDSAQHDDRISNRIATTDKTLAAKVSSTAGGHPVGTPVGTPVVSSAASKVTRTTGKLISVSIPRGVGPQGSIAYRHNNPGNLEFKNQPGATEGEPKAGGGHWAKFQTQEDGFNALARDIDIKKERNLTLREFVYVYAPPTQNNSEQYLQQVATSLGGKDTDPITRFDTILLAKAVAKKESSTSITGEGVAALQNQPAVPLPKTTPMAPVTTVSNIQPTVSGSTSHVTEDATGQKRKDAVRQMFGTQFEPLVETSPSVMKNIIMRDGYQSYPNPNAFVWNFPTQTRVTLNLQGVAGISLTDIFIVDKLPFMYERHGVFVTNKIVESIGERGWITKVEGIYKLIWLGKDGDLKLERGYLKNG